MSDSPQLDTALAEFSALRSEIASRSSAQTTILNFNLTAIAAIGTIVLSNKVSALALLTLPIICGCFGILFFDHAANIDQIGQYIDEKLKPVIRAQSKSTLFAYQEWVKKYERRAFPRAFSLGLPLLVMFAGVPIVALIRTASLLNRDWVLALWILGLSVEIVLVSYFVAFAIRPFTKSAERVAPSAPRPDA